MSVDEFLKSDRQWPHHCRVAHARMRLSQSDTKDDIAFWQAVLKANDKGRNI